MRPIKLPKGQKITKTQAGKTVIETDWEKQRRQKPAGQQFWKKDNVKVRRK